MKAQIIENSLDVRFKKWKQAQNTIDIEKIEKYIAKIIDKNNEIDDTFSNKNINTKNMNENYKMQFLLNNKRFYFEEVELQKSIAILIILEILRSRLRETKIATLKNDNSDDFMTHIQFHAFSDFFEQNDFIVEVSKQKFARVIFDFVLEFAI